MKYDSSQQKDILAKQIEKLFLPKTPELYTYDANGNMTSDGYWNFAYDDENQIISSEVVAASRAVGSKKVENTCDGLGRRRVKTVSIWDGTQYNVSSVERYVYDGWNLVAVLDGSNSLVRTYVWGIDLSGSEQGAGGVGGLLAEVNSSGTYIPYYDGNGNVTAYVDGTGVKVASYEFDPFGKIVKAEGLKANDFSYRFSTKFFDNETGLYYYGYRFYAADYGRWVNRDPIKEAGGYNLYGMCGNNPLKYYDYLGLAGDTDGYGHYIPPEQRTGYDMQTEVYNYAYHTLDPSVAAGAVSNPANDMGMGQASMMGGRTNPAGANTARGNSGSWISGFASWASSLVYSISGGRLGTAPCPCNNPPRTGSATGGQTSTPALTRSS